MATELHRLIGVYDADGTALGELTYFFNARLGRAHCSLCDITHGRVRERPEWRRAKSELPVDFVTFHRNDQPDDVRLATANRLPAVVAETDDGIELLLDGADLARCDGKSASLVTALRAAIDDHCLT